MINISPQQELFVKIKQMCISLGYSTYDYQPMNEVPYPFVFLGDDVSVDNANKTAVHGTYNLTIHVYHKDTKKRGTTSTMIMNIKQALRELKTTQSFFVSVRNINDQIITENTTNTPLLHGVIEVEFYFN